MAFKMDFDEKSTEEDRTGGDSRREYLHPH